MDRPSYFEDEVLLCRLRDAIGSRSGAPPEDRLLELRAMVCVRSPGVSGRRRARREARVPRVRSALVGAAVGLSVAGGGAAAFAAGGILPTTIRTVASHVGEPIASPEVPAARTAEHVLHLELLAANGQTPVARARAVSRPAYVLIDKVSMPTGSEQRELGPVLSKAPSRSVGPATPSVRAPVAPRLRTGRAHPRLTYKSGPSPRKPHSVRTVHVRPAPPHGASPGPTVPPKQGPPPTPTGPGPSKHPHHKHHGSGPHGGTGPGCGSASSCGSGPGGGGHHHHGTGHHGHPLPHLVSLPAPATPSSVATAVSPKP